MVIDKRKRMEEVTDLGGAKIDGDVVRGGTDELTDEEKKKLEEEKKINDYRFTVDYVKDNLKQQKGFDDTQMMYEWIKKNNITNWSVFRNEYGKIGNTSESKNLISFGVDSDYWLAQSYKDNKLLDKLVILGKPIYDSFKVNMNGEFLTVNKDEFINKVKNSDLVTLNPDEIDSKMESKKTKEIQIPHTNLYIRGFSRDSNGNGLVQVGTPNEKTRSLQYDDVFNGNPPFKSMEDLVSGSEEKKQEFFTGLRDYVKKFEKGIEMKEFTEEKKGMKRIFESGNANDVSKYNTTYGTLIVTKLPNGNLKMQFDTDLDIEDLKSDIEQKGAFEIEGYILENMMGNGWTYVLPEEVSALTDATIITDDFEYVGEEDDTKKYGKVYWDADYAVKSFVETMLNYGEAIWQGVDVEAEEDEK